jgi:peptidoglycan-associated lipoprotein
MKYLAWILIVSSLLIFVGCPSHPPKPVVTESAPPPPPDTTTKVEIPKLPEPPPVPPLQLSSIYFDYDKSDITDIGSGILSQNGKSLTDHPTATIRIEGNCDERGTEQYNLALGERRANAAKSYLVNYGIDAGRLTTISYGEERPVAAGHNEEAWSKNRRDDFTIQSE